METLKELIKNKYRIDLPITGGRGKNIDDAIIIETNNTREGVGLEYEVLSCYFRITNKNWYLKSQELLFHKETPYDKLIVAFENEPEDIEEYFFNIKNFYGKY